MSEITAPVRKWSTGAYGRYRLNQHPPHSGCNEIRCCKSTHLSGNWQKSRCWTESIGGKTALDWAMKQDFSLRLLADGKTGNRNESHHPQP